MDPLKLTDDQIKKLTPAMQQYVMFKRRQPDALILFRMGDFYEMFYDDAIKASKILDITLTSRGSNDKKAPLAGIPYHALSYYLPKLIKENIKVAICEQIEDPKKAKGLVKRDIVRVYTPGTVIENNLLDANENSYIFSIIQREDFYLVYGDISVGEIYYSKLNEDDLFNYIQKYKPKEIILSESLKINTKFLEKLEKSSAYKTYLGDIYFSREYGEKFIKTFHPDLKTAKIKKEFIGPLYALLYYIQKNHFKYASFVKEVTEIENSKYMKLDYSTVKNLDLVDNKNSLYSTINKTKTKMGSRKLKQMILNPLKKKDLIEARHDFVEKYYNNRSLTLEIREILSRLSDLERLNMKISYSNPNPKDLVALRESLYVLKELSEFQDFEIISENLVKLNKLHDVLIKGIKEDPPAIVREGNVIRKGFDSRLDELSEIRDNSKEIILQIEKKEQEKTGIKNLKIKYNKVFGYFFEVSKGNVSKVPDYFIRKQTLVNSERYVTKDIQDLEGKIVSAHEKIKTLENELFNSIISQCKNYFSIIEEISKKIAYNDVLITFAKISFENNYNKPNMGSSRLELTESRHPVIEKIESNFINNDLKMDDSEIFIITGPNMSGKSTLIRQVALNSIMAQIGCFVAASKANLPVFDNVFTRIGAKDNLAKGESTFMVEMLEVGNILKNVSKDSLVILDEIGRGTSTYDGVSLAWSIIEYLYNRVKCKSMFATHYHILNKMENEFENISNYSMAISENEDEVTFLRKLVKKGTDKSYGIYVAKLAGLPRIVLDRAEEILKKIESEDKHIQKIKSDNLKQMSLGELFK